jgi:hypothetical protein
MYWYLFCQIKNFSKVARNAFQLANRSDIRWVVLAQFNPFGNRGSNRKLIKKEPMAGNRVKSY